VKDIEDSISAVDIAGTIVEQGECQVGEIRVGPIRPGTNGLGTAWVRCPLVTANRLAKRGRLTLGWTRVRLELLSDRPTTCFRCLQAGHVRAVCPGGNADRADLCYRCGVAGHQARNCTAPPCCPLCKGSGRPDNHRVGGEACRAPKRRGGAPIRRTAVAGRTPSADARRRGVPDPEPMECAADDPSQPSESPLRLDWPNLVEGWSPTPSPPSQRCGLVTGGGELERAALRPSRLEEPIIGGGARADQATRLGTTPGAMRLGRRCPGRDPAAPSPAPSSLGSSLA